MDLFIVYTPVHTSTELAERVQRVLGRRQGHETVVRFRAAIKEALGPRGFCGIKTVAGAGLSVRQIVQIAGWFGVVPLKADPWPVVDPALRVRCLAGILRHRAELAQRRPYAGPCGRLWHMSRDTVRQLARHVGTTAETEAARV